MITKEEKEAIAQDFSLFVAGYPQFNFILEVRSDDDKTGSAERFTAGPFSDEEEA